jgi:hypothetical protein
MNQSVSSQGISRNQQTNEERSFRGSQRLDQSQYQAKAQRNIQMSAFPPALNPSQTLPPEIPLLSKDSRPLVNAQGEEWIPELAVSNLMSAEFDESQTFNLTMANKETYNWNNLGAKETPVEYQQTAFIQDIHLDALLEKYFNTGGKK